MDINASTRVEKTQATNEHSKTSPSRWHLTLVIEFPVEFRSLPFSSQLVTKRLICRELFEWQEKVYKRTSIQSVHTGTFAF